jgi:precorrin-6B methylase 2
MSAAGLRRIATALRLVCSGRLAEFSYLAWVRWHNLDFDYVGVEDLGLPSETAHFHSATPALALRRVLRDLGITSADRILDIGCGKGAAVIEFARWPFGKVAGCDISPWLVEIARANCRKLACPRVELFCADAAEFKDLDEYNYFYLFNPFPAAVMEAVMDHLVESLRVRPRLITLLYRNPTCHDCIAARDVFRLESVRPAGNHCLHVYRSVTSAGRPPSLAGQAAVASANSR